MTGPNRFIPPESQTIEKIQVPDTVLETLDNGIPCYLIGGGVQDICKIDLVFKAGSYFQPRPLVARITNLLMSEGTLKHHAFEIASIIEYYGAHLGSFTHKDTAEFTLSSLNSKIEHLLPVIEEIIKQPVFPETELHLSLSREKKNFLDDSRKVNVVALREFNKLVFGQEHPYGTGAEIHDFDLIQQQQLFDFHKSAYSSDHCFFVVSGLIRPDLVTLLNRYFGGQDWSSKKTADPFASVPFREASGEKAFLEMPGMIQNAIRIGKRTIGITHPDHPKLAVVNTILGGYFGSRLMTNIREDKGYTYGIYSALASFQKTGVFYVAAEVASEVWEPATREIYHEMDKLCNELVGEEELDLVRNYLTGSLLRLIDGPFATAALTRSLAEHGLDTKQYILDSYETIKHITAYDIRCFAQKYLQISSFSEQVTGTK